MTNNNHETIIAVPPTVEEEADVPIIFHYSPYQNANNNIHIPVVVQHEQQEFHFHQQQDDYDNDEEYDNNDNKKKKNSSSPPPPPGLHYRRRHHHQLYHHLQIGKNDNDDENSNIFTQQQQQQHHHHRQQQQSPLPLREPWTYISLIKHLYLTSFAIICSNMLEWLDFSIYGYSEYEISRQLFGGNTTFGWITFGLGYLMRPIGAYVLGRLADLTSTTTTTTSSRKFSLSLSVVGMAISTATMAIIPPLCVVVHDDNENENDSTTFSSSYCVDGGVWKTAVPVIVMRCIQGFSAGGAAGGVNVIQSELWSCDDETETPTTKKRDGALAQSVGINNVSGSSASMISAGIVFGLRALIGESKYELWGWRLAFLIVVPPSALSAYLLLMEEEEQNSNGSSPLLPVDDESTTATLSLSSKKKKKNAYIHHNDSDLDGSDGDKHTDGDNNTSDEDGNIEKEDAFQDEPTTDTTDNSNNVNVNVNDHDYFEAPPPDEAATFADNSNRNNAVVPYWLLISVSIYIQFAISAYNNLNIYMVQYAKQSYNLSAESATLMAVIGKAMQLLMSPFAALLADIVGWFGACSIGGILCSILAVPMMAANQIYDSGQYGGGGGDAAGDGDDGGGSGRIDPVLWILACGIFPIVSTIWILNAPLLATSIFPKETRGQGTSLVMAIGTALAGFFPLLLNEVVSVGTSSSSNNNNNNEIDSSRMYICGAILAGVAALGTVGILWIRNHARKGRIRIYQRVELF